MTDRPLIRNHSVWLDTDGAPIDCHEGGILRVGDRFYWYGRRYRGNLEGIYGTGGAKFRCPLVCYSSTDLVNWQNHGVCLAYPDNDTSWLVEGTWHRVRPIYNAKTGLYVLWFFCLGIPDGKAWVKDLVATSRTPTGPFTIQGERTFENFVPSGDLALLLDDDGKAYIANGDWSRNGLVAPLSEDFQYAAGPAVMVLTADRSRDVYYEGVCLEKYRGKYLYAASGVQGLSATDTTYAVADAPMGPYRFGGLMSEQKTWGSQISSFFYLKESDRLIALCDQWLTGPAGERIIAEQSCQLWLPVSFDPKTEKVRMHHVDAWNPWEREV